MERSNSTMLASTLLAGLLLSGVVVTERTSCAAGSDSSLFVGYACTAEAIAAPTSWSLNEHDAIVPSKEGLGLVVAFILLLFTHLFLAIKHPTRGLTFLQRREGPIRSGPAPNGRFLPYLFATHGW